MKKSGKSKKLYTLEVTKDPIVQPKTQTQLPFDLRSSSQPIPQALSDKVSSDEMQQIPGPSSRTRANPKKKRNESDSEIEVNNSVKQSVLKSEQRWIFASSKELFSFSATSDVWPDGFSFIQRASLEENQTTTLCVDFREVMCRLLFKGPKKAAKDVFTNYDDQLRAGVKPESMKVTYVKVDRKRKVFDDVNFLSKKLKTSGQSSSLTLGGTPSKTKSTKAKATHESTEPETPKVITKNFTNMCTFWPSAQI